MPLIRIDTSRLTYPWFWLPGSLPHFVDGSVPGGAAVVLPEGEYAFQQTRHRPSDLTFRVTARGTVDVAPEDDHLVVGRGTDTLQVLGVHVTLTAAGPPRPLLPMWGGCWEPLRARTQLLRMPPGTSYVMRLGRAPHEVVAFSVRPDGVVDFEPAYDDVLSGRGSTRLRVDLAGTAGRRPVA